MSGRRWERCLVFVLGGGDVVYFLHSREKDKDVSYVLLLYPCSESDVTFFSVVSEVCVGPQN
jgi:hypothetical protein